MFRASDLAPAPGGGSWRFDNLAGVLAEISQERASGALSFASEIIAQAQGQAEPVAWIAGTDSVFFPPDLVSRGIDVSAITVVRAGSDADSLTAAEWLLRSKSFGLVILDWEGRGSVSDASLGRVQKLAQRSGCAVVFLTRKRRDDPSLGSRISLRAFVSRPSAGRCTIDIATVKDKRSNSSSRQSRCYDGPPGMR